jgi:hypothetical protein
MPPSCAETAELLDADFFTVKSIHELSIDHCDLDFLLTVCDITRWPYRGREAPSEDTMLKRGGGVCGSICPWCGGGGWSQLLRQVEEGGPGPCVVNQGARAVKVAWLIEMGAHSKLPG